MRLSKNNEPSTQATIRVEFLPPPLVEIIVLEDALSGLSPIGKRQRAIFNADTLPKWLQRKLSVLMGLSHENPTEAVCGVGRRVSQNVYWVYLSPGETLGTNTRAKSKKRGA